MLPHLEKTALKLPFMNYFKAHHFSRAALIAAGFGVAGVFFMVGAMIRLLLGAVSLGPFNGPLSDAIQQALPGITIKYDQPAVEWSREDGRVNLVILGARMYDANGLIVAQAPKVDIDLAAAPLLRGDVVVQRITLVGVQLTLVHMQDGSIRLGVEKDKASGDIITRLNEIIKAGNSSTSSLKSFAIHRARLALMDEITGLFIVAPRADLSIETKNGDLSAALDADIEISGHPSHVVAEMVFPADRGTSEGTAKFTGFDVRALGENSENFSLVKDIPIVADISTSFVISSGSHLDRADFEMNAAGSIPVTGLKQGDLQVKSLQAVGRYDGNADTVVIQNANFDAGPTRGRLRGSSHLTYDANGALQRLDSEFTVDRVILDMPGVFAAATTLSNGQLKTSWIPDAHEVLVDSLVLKDGPLDFNVSGKVSFAAGLSPAVVVTGKMAALPIRDLLRYWPMNVAPGSRAWIDANVRSGTVGPIAVETQIPAGALDADALADESVNVSFALSDAEVTYLRGLTPMTGVSGTATLMGNTFKAQVTRARIGPLAVSQGTFQVSNLRVKGTPGAITAHVDGGLPDVLRLIDMQPLGYPTRFGIDPGKTAGSAAVDLNFRVPLLRNLSVDDIGIDVRASTRGLAVSLGSKLRLTDGNIQFEVGNDRLRANGNTAIADSRLNVDWTEEFHTSDPITTQVRAQGTLGDGARSMLSFGLDDILTGPSVVDATIAGARGSIKTADLSLNLAQSRIALDVLGIEKKAGTAMNATANVIFAPGNIVQAATFRMSGPNGGSAGNAAFDSSGKLTLLSFPALRMGDTDIALTVTRGGAGTDVNIRGSQLDGSRLAARGSNESSVAKADPAAASKGQIDEPSFVGPFHVNARVDRMLMREGVAVAPFALDISGIDNRPASLSLAGSLTNDATITASLAQTNDGRRITLNTTDAGTLVKGLIGFQSLRGGTIDLEVNLPGRATNTAPRDAKTPDFSGKLAVSDVRVLNQSFLTRLFSAGSLIGAANLLGGNGIAVDDVEVPYSSKNGVIAITDARLSGPAIGATADGYIDRPKNVIALKGTLVPISGINSVLGIVPLLGDLLVSKQGEGIIGITYSVSGDADQPDISVNPLSALTPGILRRLFQGKMPDAANAPSNAQQPEAASPPNAGSQQAP